MSKRAVIVGLGEILWDVLPSGRVLGGAATNFAYMTNVLGDQGVVASRIGIDDLGQETREAMEGLGLSTSYLQNDEEHETSTVTVSLDSEGQPTFGIKGPVAWDQLQWTSEWEELAQRAEVICFGSLAQRSPASALTIDRFLRSTSPSALRIFDVNLRESFYTTDVLLRSLHHADVVKLNEHELLKVSSLFNFEGADDKTLAKRIVAAFDLQLVCITRGARGSLLVTEGKMVEHLGIKVIVADSIGAGDAFTACLAHHYIRNRPLEEISEAANRFASLVATQVGATPPMGKILLQDIRI
jgi:fructokinase